MPKAGTEYNLLTAQLAQAIHPNAKFASVSGFTVRTANERLTLKSAAKWTDTASLP